MPARAFDQHARAVSDETGSMIDGFAAAAQVAGAQRVARALTVGFGLCEEAGFPLSERQRISMLTAALLAFDGFQAETEGLLHIEQLLAGLARRDSPAS